MHGSLHEWCMGGGGEVMMWWEWENCMCVLPGLLRFGLSIGGGLDGVGEEVIGVVSGCEIP